MLQKLKFIHSLITVFMLTESQLLTPDVFESPELKRVRIIALVAMPSVVFDSESDRICFEFLANICEGKLPTGSVRERCVEDVATSSRIVCKKMKLKYFKNSFKNLSHLVFSDGITRLFHIKRRIENISTEIQHCTIVNSSIIVSRHLVIVS